jgi:hypothetical protein
MGGRWQHRQDKAAHQRIREALLPYIAWGETPCPRCGHALQEGQRVELDHDDETGGYAGFSHGSPCYECGQRCNPRAGGIKAALGAGKTLRSKVCPACGLPFDGSGRTCGRPSCRAALAAATKAGRSLDAPGARTGRKW